MSSAPCPITLRVRQPHYMVGGLASVVELELANTSEHPVARPTLELASPTGLLRPATWQTGDLAPGAVVSGLLETHPRGSGHFIWNWKLTLPENQTPIPLWEGQQKVRVYSEDAIQSVTLNIDVNNSSGSREKSHLGAAFGEVHIHDLITSNAIRSVNDFIEAERPDAVFEAIMLLPAQAPAPPGPASPPTLPTGNQASSPPPPPEEAPEQHPDRWNRKRSGFLSRFKNLFDDQS